MANCACLACYTAALNVADDVEFVSCAGESERLTNYKFKCFKAEIIVDITIVYRYFA